MMVHKYPFVENGVSVYDHLICFVETVIEQGVTSRVNNSESGSASSTYYV